MLICLKENLIVVVFKRISEYLLPFRVDGTIRRYKSSGKSDEKNTETFYNFFQSL